MTVGRPCVEWEEGSQHAETDEKQGEEDVLHILGDIGHSRNLIDVHRGGSTEEVDGQDADDEQRRTTHKHQGEFHGGILLGACTPYSDKQIHRDKGYLVEHEHGEHIYRDEEAEHTGAEQGEPEEVFLVVGHGLPRGKGSGEDNDGRQQEHHDRDAIDAYAVGDMERGEPCHAVGEQHGVGVTGMAHLYKSNGKPDGKDQQGAGTCYHYATYLSQVLGKPEPEEHQDGDNYE